jgi:hypothetical protein
MHVCVGGGGGKQTKKGSEGTNFYTHFSRYNSHGNCRSINMVKAGNFFQGIEP